MHCKRTNIWKPKESKKARNMLQKSEHKLDSTKLVSVMHQSFVTTAPTYEE